MQNPVIELLSMFGAGVIILFVFHTGKSAPQLVGFLTGMIMLYQPIKKLGGLNQYYQEASVGVGMLRVAFDTQASVAEVTEAKALPRLREGLKFEAVDFQLWRRTGAARVGCGFAQGKPSWAWWVKVARARAHW